MAGEERLAAAAHGDNGIRASDDTARFWPRLDYPSWRDTVATFQLWTQIVGKVRLALSPWLNHGWQVPLYVNARGLGTSPIHAGRRIFEIEFDLVDNRLTIRAPDAVDRGIDLEPMSVATFYRRFMAELDAAGIDVEIGVLPNEVPIRSASPTTRCMARMTQRRSTRSGAHSCRPTVCCACSAPRSWARQARCTSSGAVSTSPSPAFRAVRRRLTLAACRAYRMPSRARPTRMK